MIRRVWEFTARWRTWLWNALSILTIAALHALATPEVQALLPEGWLPWALAINAVVNIWMRPRRAVLATDHEAAVSRAYSKGRKG